MCILSLWLGDARPKVEDVGCSVPALHQIDKFFEYFGEQLGHSCPRFEGHLIFFHCDVAEDLLLSPGSD